MSYQSESCRLCFALRINEAGNARERFDRRMYLDLPYLSHLVLGLKVYSIIVVPPVLRPERVDTLACADAWKQSTRRLLSEDMVQGKVSPCRDRVAI